MKWEEMGLGTPKKKMVKRRKRTESERAMVKKWVKRKLIKAVLLRDFLEEILDLGVVDEGRRERAHVEVPRRVLEMYEEMGMVELVCEFVWMVGEEDGSDRIYVCKLVKISKLEV